MITFKDQVAVVTGAGRAPRATTASPPPVRRGRRVPCHSVGGVRTH
jgi:hypothetical protein